MPTIELSQYYVEFIGFLLTLIVGLSIRDAATSFIKGAKFRFNPAFSEGDKVLLDGNPALIVKDNDKLDYISAKDDIFEKINDLSEKLKETLMLVTVQKKTYKEASEILQVPIGTIMSRIHEARRILTKQNDELNKEIKK